MCIQDVYDGFINGKYASTQNSTLDATLRLNVLKVTTLFLLIASLFLPWFSYNLLSSDGSSSLHHFSYEYSPSMSHYRSITSLNGTLDKDEYSYCFPPFFPWRFILILHQLDHYDLFFELSNEMCGFSVCFAVVALFATSVWKSSAKMILQITLCFLLFGIALSLASYIHVYNTASEAMKLWAASLHVPYGEYEEFFFANTSSINIGFSLLILSIFSLTVSYLSPKFVSLPLDFNTSYLRKWKENWLTISDKERWATLFLLPFTMTGFFFLLLLLIYFV